MLGKYTFGLTDGDGRIRAAGPLWAICTKGKSIRYVDVAKALAEIAGRWCRGGRQAERPARRVATDFRP